MSGDDAQSVGSETENPRLFASGCPPQELGEIAHGLANSKSRAVSAKLAAKITDGFYAGS